MQKSEVNSDSRICLTRSIACSNRGSVGIQYSSPLDGSGKYGENARVGWLVVCHDKITRFERFSYHLAKPRHSLSRVPSQPTAKEKKKKKQPSAKFTVSNSAFISEIQTSQLVYSRVMLHLLSPSPCLCTSSAARCRSHAAAVSTRQAQGCAPWSRPPRPMSR